MFEIWLCSPLGVRDKLLEDFTSLHIVRVVNGVGVFTIDAAATIDRNFLALDRVIEIDYIPTGGSARLETVGFIRKILYYDANEQERVKITCYTPEYLLTGRIIAYAADSSQASMSGYADDLLKEIVRDNLGSDASAGRNLSSLGLSVGANLSDAPIIEKGFAWRPLMQVLLDICAVSEENGTRLFFNLQPSLQSSASYVFMTYTGQPSNDRGAGSGREVYFGKSWGNLDNPSLEYDWSNEVNYIYAGGQGEGSNRVIVEVQDVSRVKSSPWNRRETFTDARNEKSTTGVQAKAYSALNAGKPQVKLNGTLRNSDSIRYGIEWGLGDVVIVEYQGSSFNVLVTRVEIKIDENGLDISGNFRVLG